MSFYNIWIVFKFYAKHFIKAPLGMSVSLGFPIILVIVLGNVLNRAHIMSGLIGASVYVNCVMVMPNSILEIRNSSILKRIAVSPLKQRDFAIAIFIFYAALNTFLALFHLPMGYAFLQWRSNDLGKWHSIVQNLHWGYLISGVLLSTFTATSVGMLLAIFCKTPLQATSIGTMVFLSNSLIGSQYLPVFLMRDNGVLWNVSYLTFTRHTQPFLFSAFSKDLPYASLTSALSQGVLEPNGLIYPLENPTWFNPLDFNSSTYIFIPNINESFQAPAINSDHNVVINMDGLGSNILSLQDKLNFGKVISLYNKADGILALLIPLLSLVGCSYMSRRIFITRR